MSAFSSRLKSIRKENFLTQKDIASSLGISDVMISKYESGDAYPSYDTLILLSKLFNVSLDYLCGTDYYLNEENNDYIIEDKLLKIIKRSKILSSFILDDPRTNVLLLENYIKQIN